MEKKKVKRMLKKLASEVIDIMVLYVLALIIGGVMGLLFHTLLTLIK